MGLMVVLGYIICLLEGRLTAWGVFGGGTLGWLFLSDMGSDLWIHIDVLKELMSVNRRISLSHKQRAELLQKACRVLLAKGHSRRHGPIYLRIRVLVNSQVQMRMRYFPESGQFVSG